MITAELKNYRHSPRKVRMLADLVRGKKVNEAVTTLMFATKKASNPLKKLIESAIANAKHNFNLKAEDLYVKSITVDAGITMHRWMPRAHGATAPLRKRSSIVKVVLAEKAGKKAEEKVDSKETKAEVKSKAKPKNK